MRVVFGAAIILTLAAAPLVAQWPAYQNVPNTPKLPDGKVDLKAPAPRTPDGKPDLSGVWETAPCPDCAPPVIDGLSPTPGSGQAAASPGDARGQQGRGNAVAPPAAAGGGRGGGRGNGGFGRNVFGNIGGTTPEGEAPYQPWARELVQKRMADNSKDNPDAHCLPMGFLQFHNHPEPRKMIQTPNLLVIIYEANSGLRQIFMDGRKLPNKDNVEPWYYGYSVGHWEGDTLVVETTGFMDGQWLDVRGSPMTDAAKVTEKFRRPNYGNLEIEITVDDPKAYTKPWTVKVNQRIMPDTELIEFICEDRDATHYVGTSK